MRGRCDGNIFDTANEGWVRKGSYPLRTTVLVAGVHFDSDWSFWGQAFHAQKLKKSMKIEYANFRFITFL